MIITTETVIGLLAIEGGEHGAVGELKKEALTGYLQKFGGAALVDLFVDFAALAIEVQKNTRKVISPHAPEGMEVNLPSLTGAIRGREMANEAKGRCAGCAFRRGTEANQSLNTLCDAGNAERFVCHEDKRRTCRGWLESKS